MTALTVILLAFGLALSTAFTGSFTSQSSLPASLDLRSGRSTSPLLRNAPTWGVTLPPPASLKNPFQSSTSLSGLFGLGGPEIAICLVVAGVVLGPQKLGEMTKELGKVAGELKDVPEEFQKGMAEGESNTKAMKAKVMKKPLVEDAAVVKEDGEKEVVE